jgi:translocation protein SEC63
MFIQITKANKVLTDEEAKLLFDEFGHPDGKQAFTLGLALPSWLVQAENSSLVLLIYTILFGIGMPVMVAKWWSSAKVMSKYAILNITMANFYRDLNDSLVFKGIVSVAIGTDRQLL